MSWVSSFALDDLPGCTLDGWGRNEANDYICRWLHVPRGCAVFHVPLRNQHLIRSTLPTSHGFQPKPVPPFGSHTNPLPPSNKEKSDFEISFEFIGTVDTSPYLCIPAAIAWRESIGGEDAIITYCQTLALEGGKRMAEILGTEILDNKTGTLTKCPMVNVALPLDPKMMFELGKSKGLDETEVGTAIKNWSKRLFLDEYNTFMFTMFYGGKWWVRMSGQVYLEMADFEWAAEVVKKVCKTAEKGEWAVKAKARL